jgi:hypothetical protein
MALREKLKSFQAEEEMRKRDARVQLDAWRQAVAKLNHRIQADLKEYLDDGLMTFSFGATDHYEELVGQYILDTMSLKVGPHRIVIEPVGFRVIGASGRVNAYRVGRQQDGVMLLWRPEKGADHWDIATLEDRRNAVPYSKAQIEAHIERMIEG